MPRCSSGCGASSPTARCVAAATSCGESSSHRSFRPDAPAGPRGARIRRGGRGRPRGFETWPDRDRRARRRHGDAVRRWGQGGRRGARRAQLSRGEARRDGAARTALGAEIPVVLMTSFATDAAVRAHVAERRLGQPLFFPRRRPLACGPDGSLFVGADGRASLYGPGHGDLLSCIRSSGTLAELERRGVESVIVSNVDNLGARVDPVVVGMHLLAQTPLTVEVVAKGRRLRRCAGAGGRPPAARRGAALSRPSSTRPAYRSSTRTRR